MIVYVYRFGSGIMEDLFVAFRAMCFNHVKYGQHIHELPRSVCDNHILVEFQCLMDEIIRGPYEREQVEIYKHAVLETILYVRGIQNGLGCGPLAYKLMESYLQQVCVRGGNVFSYTDIHNLLVKFVEHNTSGDEYNYGSWKDVFHFMQLLKHSEILHSHYAKAIINFIVESIVVPQMRQDIFNMNNKSKISLCGKWLPRESSREFKWMAKHIALKYYTIVHSTKPRTKMVAYKHYRTLCSSFNLYLKTPQVYMSARRWHKIVFERVSSATLKAHKDKFLNVDNLCEDHRMWCKQNYLDYIHK